MAPIPHIVGLELLNEPANNQKLQGWYESTLSTIRPICGPDFPLYISDAWDTQHYCQFVGKRSDFVVLDHHLYRTFTDEDSKLTGVQHAQNLRSGFKNTFKSQSDAANGNIVVGEWSASISPKSIGSMPSGEQDRQRREFVNAQLDLYKECSGGYWFWTLKLEEPWNAGWSAMNAARAEILPKSVGDGQKGQPRPETKQQASQAAECESTRVTWTILDTDIYLASHRGYWASHGGSPNPAVFAPGFSQGWDDELLFRCHSAGTSTLGFIGQWRKKRRIEYESQHGSLGKATWEWEHGFAQGVEACRNAS